MRKPWEAAAEDTRAGREESPSATAPRFISHLSTRRLEPAPSFDLDLGRRLNLVVGDNSLGKTFMLDVLWWALTGNWRARPAKPMPRTKKNGGRREGAPTILASAGKRSLASHYDALHELWPLPAEGPLAPGLVIYAGVEGGFSVWDPIRNAAPVTPGELDLREGYHFTRESLWTPLLAQDGQTMLCRGIIDDAVSWQSHRDERRRAHELLQQALEALSPPGERIRLGAPRRFGVKDARDFPTLSMKDGDIFAVHASEAIKRVLSLAYVLVWSISEIQRAAPVAERSPLRRVTMLIDEVEAHLHPKWQREILPALLPIVKALAPQARTQLVVTTHSPLVLASVETLFDPKKDALIHFELVEGQGQARRIDAEREPWRVWGDVNSWLTSPLIGLREPYSKATEEVLVKAMEALRRPVPDLAEIEALTPELRKHLKDTDPLWPRWLMQIEHMKKAQRGKGSREARS